MTILGKVSVGVTGKRSVYPNGKAAVYYDEDDCCKCKTCEDVEFPCEITLIHIDENRCEDDIFNIYIKNPGTGARRFIEQIDLVSDPPGCCNWTCPQTRIDVPISLTAEDLDSDCRFTVEAELAGTNCCGTWTRIRIEGPSGQTLFGSYFAQEGYSQTFDARQICTPVEEDPP